MYCSQYCTISCGSARSPLTSHHSASLGMQMTQCLCRPLARTDCTFWHHLYVPTGVTLVHAHLPEHMSWPGLLHRGRWSTRQRCVNLTCTAVGRAHSRQYYAVCSCMQYYAVCSCMQYMCSLSLVSIESTECLQPKTTATVGAHKGYCKRCGAVGWMVSKKYIHRYSQ